MNKFYSPWLSRGLLKSMSEKNRLFKKLVRSPTTSCELKCEANKNKLNHLIRIAKRTYYDSKLEDANNDLRRTWKLVNEVINKRQNNPCPPTSFKSDGKTITDPMDIADRFCKYFTNIGPNLASAIHTVNSSTFRSFLGSRDYPPIILKPTDTRQLQNICSLVLPRKAPGCNNISMRAIKHSFYQISAPLTNIINLSLLKGISSDKLKIGKVIPIYKTEDPSLFVNYRPISLLPVFSKFFEKVMYNRLY